MGQLLYRIIRGERPTIDDFKSHKAVGKPLLDARWRREWEADISTFDTLDYAVRRARALRIRIGDWVVALELPDDGTIESRQTGDDSHHLTVYGAADELLTLIRGMAVSARSERGE